MRLLTNDQISYVVIIINAVALFCLGFVEGRGAGAFQGHNLFEQSWNWVDYACVLYFLAEAIAKIRRYGWNAYWSDGWNQFDLLVVIISSPTLFAPFIQVADFRVATALRLGRLFRLFRLLHMIPNRSHLALGIGRAIQSSIGVFLALFLLAMIFSLGATFLFGNQAPQYFGNPVESFYSIFKIFTVEGWYEIPDAMTGGEDGPMWTLAVRAFFMFTVAVGGILGLSIANAVFVDEMVMDNNQNLEEKIDLLTQEVLALRKELESRKEDAS